MKRLGAVCALAAAFLATVVMAHQDEGDIALNDKVRITELRLKGDYDDDDFLFFGGGVAELCASMIFSHLDHNQRPLSKDIELPNPGGQTVSFKQGQQIWWASVFCKDVNMSDTSQDFYQSGASFPYVLVSADAKQANAWGNELPGGDQPMPWHEECRPKALWEVNILVTEMKGNSQEFVKKIGEAVNSKPTQAAAQSQPLVAAGLQVAVALLEFILQDRDEVVGSVILRLNGSAGKHEADGQGGDVYAKAEALIEEQTKPCATPTPTQTSTPNPTAPTPAGTAPAPPTPTAAPTIAPTAAVTPTASATVPAAATATPTASPTPTATPTSTATPTQTAPAISPTAGP